MLSVFNAVLRRFQRPIAPVKTQINILLVEDNLVIQVMTLGLLRGLGYEASLATDGKKAISMVDRKHYDLILLDCQLPSLDGLTVLRHIRLSRNKSAVVAAYTAGLSDSDWQSLRDNGMTSILRKPVTEESLKRLLISLNQERP